MRFLTIAVSAIAALAYSPAYAGNDGVATKACAKVNSAAGKIASGMSGGISTLAAGSGIALKAFGISSLSHSSSAAIVAVGGKYVAGTLGAVGAAVGVVTSPVVIGAGVVTAVATSGAVAYCHYSQA